MKKGRSSNLGLAKDDHELEQSFGIGVGIEHGKSLGQESQQDDPGRPNVDGWRLVLTLEEDFGSSEASCTSSVGSYTRPVRAKMKESKSCQYQRLTTGQLSLLPTSCHALGRRLSRPFEAGPLACSLVSKRQRRAWTGLDHLLAVYGQSRPEY